MLCATTNGVCSGECPVLFGTGRRKGGKVKHGVAWHGISLLAARRGGGRWVGRTGQSPPRAYVERCSRESGRGGRSQWGLVLFVGEALALSLDGWMDGWDVFSLIPSHHALSAPIRPCVLAHKKDAIVYAPSGASSCWPIRDVPGAGSARPAAVSRCTFTCVCDGVVRPGQGGEDGWDTHPACPRGCSV